MHIVRITAYRDGYFAGADDASKPFNVEVEVKGSYSKTTLKLSPDLSRRIMEIIGDEVINAARDMAQNMTKEAIAGDYKVGDQVNYKPAR